MKKKKSNLKIQVIGKNMFGRSCHFYEIVICIFFLNSCLVVFAEGEKEEEKDDFNNISFEGQQEINIPKPST